MRTVRLGGRARVAAGAATGAATGVAALAAAAVGWLRCSSYLEQLSDLPIGVVVDISEFEVLHHCSLKKMG